MKASGIFSFPSFFTLLWYVLDTLLHRFGLHSLASGYSCSIALSFDHKSYPQTTNQMMWLRLLSGRRRFWMLSRQDAHTSARAMERLYSKKKKKLIHTDLNNAITAGIPSVCGMDKHQRNLTKMWSLERRDAAKITNPEKAKLYLAVSLSMVCCRMSDNAPGKSAY